MPKPTNKKKNVSIPSTKQIQWFSRRKTIERIWRQITCWQKAPIESALQELKDAHKNQDINAINTAIDKLNNVFQAASQEMYNAQAQQQQGGAQQEPQGNPNAGANNGGKDQEVTDVDFEEVK